MDYGLAFYLNEPIVHYDTNGVPDAEHILVVRANDTAGLTSWLTGRLYEPLFLYESQGLEVLPGLTCKSRNATAEITAASIHHIYPDTCYIKFL